MPRKVTKTMREARQRAAKQKRARNQFQAQISSSDYTFGHGNIHDTRRTVVQAEAKADENLRSKIKDTFTLHGTVTGRINADQLNTGAKSRSSSGTADSQDFSALEQRLVNEMSAEEYDKREAIAQKEIEHKKNCIAPAYNKGAYTYIASEEMAKDVGKK